MMAPTSSVPFNTALIIPTGVGAQQGGFGGDATVWLNLLASVSDTLITHPNVANAASFQRLPANALYVEGSALDCWFQGQLALRPVHQNRVGVVLDAGIKPGMQTLHHNVINAVRCVYGVPILEPILTEEPLDLRLHTEASGASNGSLANPEVLLKAAEQAITAGAEALAIAARLEEPEDSTYSHGVGADPIGGLEAIVSHYIGQAFNLPCAHAPVFDWAAAAPKRDEVVDPRTAAEYITPSFLPCVLTGLHRAPRWINRAGAEPAPLQAQDLGVEACHALVLPINAVGGTPFFEALSRRIPIITVASNSTVLAVTAEALLGPEAVEALKQQGLLLEAHSYAEAAGFLQLLRLGLSVYPVK